MTADQILGKRFRFTDGSAPDMTAVAVDPYSRIRVHGSDGSKAWLPAAEFQAAIDLGILTETPGPFALDMDGADVATLTLMLEQILKGQIN